MTAAVAATTVLKSAVRCPCDDHDACRNRSVVCDGSADASSNSVDAGARHDAGLDGICQTGTTCECHYTDGAVQQQPRRRRRQRVQFSDRGNDKHDDITTDTHDDASTCPLSTATDDVTAGDTRDDAGSATDAITTNDDGDGAPGANTNGGRGDRRHGGNPAERSSDGPADAQPEHGRVAVHSAETQVP